MKNKIKEHFKKEDPILFAVLSKMSLTEEILPPLSKNYFQSLCRSIIGQQLSRKAAQNIFDRFIKLFKEKNVTSENLLKIKDKDIRIAGLSYSKIKYLKDLAGKIVKNELKINKIDTLKNEEVIIELTKVKGIGRWTAEMFLMFSLSREDVFSNGDLGLKKGIQKIYKLKKLPTLKQMEKLSKKWIPYRTYASRILWRSLEI